jgi:hypothetical protein
MSCFTPLQRGRLVQRAFQFLTSASKLLQTRGREDPTMEEAKKGRFSAGPLGVGGVLEPTPNLGAAD